MANCASCSAPLAANTQYCSYCRVRNDIDLQGKHDYHVIDSTSERVCPECEQSLQTISLDAAGSLRIERCAHCFGLFFDPGEIESLLESAVAPVVTVNLELLNNINQDRFPQDTKVKYLKCPVCQVLMNRLIYGYRSGVIIDQCRSHGIWLDGGQISHLLEWKKAGGQILNQQQIAAKQEKVSSEQFKKAFRKDYSIPQQSQREQGIDGDLVASVAEVIFRIFE
jgi:Zn-finger nucleic acid-binding protein